MIHVSKKSRDSEKRKKRGRDSVIKKRNVKNGRNNERDGNVNANVPDNNEKEPR